MRKPTTLQGVSTSASEVANMPLHRDSRQQYSNGALAVHPDVLQANAFDIIESATRMCELQQELQTLEGALEARKQQALLHNLLMSQQMAARGAPGMTQLPMENARGLAAHVETGGSAMVQPSVASEPFCYAGSSSHPQPEFWGVAAPMPHQQRYQKTSATALRDAAQQHRGPTQQGPGAVTAQAGTTVTLDAFRNAVPPWEMQQATPVTRSNAVANIVQERMLRQASTSSLTSQQGSVNEGFRRNSGDSQRSGTFRQGSVNEGFRRNSGDSQRSGTFRQASFDALQYEPPVDHPNSVADVRNQLAKICLQQISSGSTPRSSFQSPSLRSSLDSSFNDSVRSSFDSVRSSFESSRRSSIESQRRTSFESPFHARFVPQQTANDFAQGRRGEYAAHAGRPSVDSRRTSFESPFLAGFVPQQTANDFAQCRRGESPAHPAAGLPLAQAPVNGLVPAKAFGRKQDKAVPCTRLSRRSFTSRTAGAPPPASRQVQAGCTASPSAGKSMRAAAAGPPVEGTPTIQGVDLPDEWDYGP